MNYLNFIVPKSRSARQRGFTVIELTVVIVVISIMLVLALRNFGLLSKSKGSVEGTNVGDTINAVQTCFAKSTDFSGLGASASTGTTYALTNCGIDVANAPAKANGTTSITNQFGGARTIARTNINSGTNNAVIVSDAAIPKDICPDVIQNLWDVANVIVITPVGGSATTVKSTWEQRYEPDAIGPCKNASDVTIDVTRAKNY